MIFKKRIQIILLFSILSVFMVQSFSKADEVKVLSLEDSVKVALENNKSLLSSKEKLIAAKGKVTEVEAQALPQINASGTYTRLDEAPSENASEDSYGIKLNLQQPVFTWGRLSSAIDLAKVEKTGADEDYEKARQQIVFDTEKAFYDLLLAQELLKVSKESLDLAERHADNVKNMFESGTVSKFDKLRAEVQVANIKPNVIKAENSVKLMSIAFNNTVGLPLDAKVSLKGGFKYEKKTVNHDEAVKTALDNRPDYKRMSLSEKSAQDLLVIAKANNKPSVYFVANYENKGTEMDFDKWNDSWNATVSVSVPVFDGFATKAKVTQAEASLNQVVLGKQMLEDGIRLEVEQANQQIAEADEMVAATTKVVEQAKESLNISKVSYQNGVVTNLEVMDAQLALTQAETNYLQALYSHQVAWLKLAKALGQL